MRNHLNIWHPIQRYNRIKNAMDFIRPFTEVFVMQQYSWLYNHLKPNTTLIDLGAAMGDTAIYFAPNPRIKAIKGYEPVKRYYNEANRFLTFSPFKDKIKYYNMAVGGAGGIINPETNQKNGIQYTSLTSILKGLKNVAIKSDCEGAERYMFDNVDLKEVYAIQIECHFNSVRNMKSKMKKHGFRATIPKPFGLDPGVGNKLKVIDQPDAEHLYCLKA